MEALGKIANGIGQPVRRKEDFRLLTGRGTFSDDIQLPGLAHAVIVRSSHAHAHIRSIDKAAALASPGVLAVLTGSDYIVDGLAPIPLALDNIRRFSTQTASNAPKIARSRGCGFPRLAAGTTSDRLWSHLGVYRDPANRRDRRNLTVQTRPGERPLTTHCGKSA